jgi:hypothetical protein
MDYKVYHGGLLRCCLASLDEAMAKATEPPKDGDRIKCQYHDNWMIFRDGAWKWDVVPWDKPVSPSSPA